MSETPVGRGGPAAASARGSAAASAAASAAPTRPGSPRGSDRSHADVSVTPEPEVEAPAHARGAGNPATIRDGVILTPSMALGVSPTARDSLLYLEARTVVYPCGRHIVLHDFEADASTLMPTHDKARAAALGREDGRRPAVLTAARPAAPCPPPPRAASHALPPASCCLLLAPLLDGKSGKEWKKKC